MLYATDRNVLDAFWWHDCTTCDKCITTGGDDKAEKKKEVDTKHEELKEHDKLDHEDKVTSSKDKRKKLLKLMILSQMISNNSK